MKTLVVRAVTLAVSAMLAFAGTAQAQNKQLTLCWAAWDPANALVELSKDFTAKTGIAMKFEFVPWPNFADRMLNDLDAVAWRLRSATKALRNSTANTVASLANHPWGIFVLSALWALLQRNQLAIRQARPKSLAEKKDLVTKLEL